MHSLICYNVHTHEEDTVDREALGRKIHKTAYARDARRHTQSVLANWHNNARPYGCIKCAVGRPKRACIVVPQPQKR